MSFEPAGCHLAWRRLLTLCLPTIALLVCDPRDARAQLPVESFTEPYRRVDLAPAEPGTVATIQVREGDSVKKGQVLATLEHDLLLVARETALANIASDGRLNAVRAELKLRQDRRNRLESLHQRGYATAEEVATAQADLDVALANVQIAAEQQVLQSLELAKVDTMIERRKLRSPIDGYIVRVYREEGEYVSTSSPNVATIAQLDKLRATFSVSTSETRPMSVGQVVLIEFPDTQQKAKAVVESISPITDPESGTVRVRVVIDNPTSVYRCGRKCFLTPSAGSSHAAAK